MVSSLVPALTIREADFPARLAQIAANSFSVPSEVVPQRRPVDDALAEAGAQGTNNAYAKRTDRIDSSVISSAARAS
jgi:hypothetical protein